MYDREKHIIISNVCMCVCGGGGGGGGGILVRVVEDGGGGGGGSWSLCFIKTATKSTLGGGFFLSDLISSRPVSFSVSKTFKKTTT